MSPGGPTPERRSKVEKDDQCRPPGLGVGGRARRFQGNRILDPGGATPPGTARLERKVTTSSSQLKLRAARSTFDSMTIELSGNVEEQLRDFAAQQGRDVTTLVEDAVLQYLEAADITDLEPSDVAEAQAALLGEIPDVPVWKADEV